jgi:hypothetical protein
MNREKGAAFPLKVTIFTYGRGCGLCGRFVGAPSPGFDIFVLYACINPKEHGYLGDGAAHR